MADCVVCPEDRVEAGEDDCWRTLGGLKVALYSLRETALRRARQVLSELCPGASIDVYSDKVGGGSSLGAAAARADLFVIAVGAAKHAATEFISARRSAGQATVYARGQGTAGLLAAVRSFAESMSGNRALD